MTVATARNAASRLLSLSLATLRRPTALLFLASFGISKIIIYLVPLGIALTVSPEIYGAIELSQSVGLLVATFVVGPAAQGLTQCYLVRREQRFADVAWLQVALGAGLCLVASLVAAIAGASDLVLLIAASFAAAAYHVTGNSIALMLGARNVSTWTAGTNILLAAVVIAIAFLLPGGPTLRGITFIYLAGAAAGLGVSVVALLRTWHATAWHRVWEVSRIGLPMVLVGGLSIWLSVGGRIVVGTFNPGALAVYGIAFRIGGLLLGFHQLAMTAFFVTIYRGRIRVSDRIMGVALAAILVTGVVLSLLAGLIGPIFELDSAMQARFAAILPLTVLHTHFWIGQAMLQMRINRYDLAKPALAPTAIATIAGIAITAGIAQFVSNDLELLCWLIAAHAAVLYAVTSLVLRQRRVPHRLTDIAVVGGAAALTLVTILT